MEMPIVIGDYKLESLIGKGVYAKVYRASDSENDKIYAIKCLEKKKRGIPKRIEKEIRAMECLKHPNVVRLYDTISTDRNVYLVMEYVDGGTLTDLLHSKGGRLEENQARLYFQQLICALQYCHKKGVFHRDLKTDNLLIDRDGNLKVSDFGLCALQTKEEMKRKLLQKTTCGTIEYVAPEMFYHGDYDSAKTDIWACGILLYIILTGAFPFENANRPQLLKQIMAADFSCPGWLRNEMQVILHRILQPEPENRITINGIMELNWFKESLCLREDFDDDSDCHYYFATKFSPSNVTLNLDNVEKDGKDEILRVTKGFNNMSLTIDGENERNESFSVTKRFDHISTILERGNEREVTSSITKDVNGIS